jgi:hypothetical protein
VSVITTTRVEAESRSLQILHLPSEQPADDTPLIAVQSVPWPVETQPPHELTSCKRSRHSKPAVSLRGTPEEIGQAERPAGQLSSTDGFLVAKLRRGRPLGFGPEQLRSAAMR